MSTATAVHEDMLIPPVTALLRVTGALGLIACACRDAERVPAGSSRDIGHGILMTSTPAPQLRCVRETLDPRKVCMFSRCLA